MIREIAGESTVTEGAKEMQEVHGAEKLAQEHIAEEDDDDEDEPEEEKSVSTPAASTRSKVRQRKK